MSTAPTLIPWRKKKRIARRKKADRAGCPLVVEHLDVGEAGGVVDADVDELPAGAASSVVAGHPAHHLLAGAVDPSQLPLAGGRHAHLGGRGRLGESRTAIEHSAAEQASVVQVSAALPCRFIRITSLRLVGVDTPSLQGGPDETTGSGITADMSRPLSSPNH